MEQMHEIERMFINYKQHKMYMDETIIVSSTIDKFSPSWKDFKRNMKRKKGRTFLLINWEIIFD